MLLFIIIIYMTLCLWNLSGDIMSLLCILIFLDLKLCTSEGKKKSFLLKCVLYTI